ncbi:MAG: hypothetical protein IJS12_06140 [Lachnospiraceae bacterium]|nr:hypothetical protein [Lachnospiraceae bacterium]
MSVFEDKEIYYCPLCGSKINEDDAYMLSNGAICGVCKQRFADAGGDDPASMSVLEVRNVINAGNIIETGNVIDTEPYDGICPICGKPFEHKAHRIADGYICADCEHMERSMYYIDGDTDELDEVNLDAVREDFVLYKQRICDAVDSAPSHAESVAYVDDSFSDGSKTVVLVCVAKGEFREGDEVILIHDGELASAGIIIAYAAEGYSYEEYRNGVISTTLRAGEYGWLVFKDIEPIYGLTDIIYIL